MRAQDTSTGTNTTHDRSGSRQLPRATPVTGLLALQRAAGNMAVTRAIRAQRQGHDADSPRGRADSNSHEEEAEGTGLDATHTAAYAGNHTAAGNTALVARALASQVGAGNAAVVQMLGQAGHPWTHEQHQHGAGCGHQQTEPGQQPAVQRSTVHDVRAQVADRRSPEAPARAVNATPPAVRAHAPLAPQGMLALQRTVGNQAAIVVVARKPQPQQQQEAPQQGGGGSGGYLHGWLVWLFAWFAWLTRNAQRQAPVAVEAAPVAEPTPPPVAAPKAVAEEAPPPTTAPVITAKEPLVISEYERGELRTKFRKLLGEFDETEDARLQIRVDQLSEEIEPLLGRGTSVPVDKLKKVEHDIDNIYRAIEKASASQPKTGESSKKPAVTNAEGRRPVEIEIQYGTKIGSSAAGWGKYGHVVERVIGEMRDGRVTLGPDSKPKLGLSVKGHLQDNFIKVYLDAEDRGAGTQMRGYFRYKVVRDRRLVIIKLVAIRKEHGGKDTTVFGDYTEVVSETES